MSTSRREILSGWGRHPSVASRVARPETRTSLKALVEGNAALLARGAGRSYGDAALTKRGATVLTGRLNRMLDFDCKSGVLRAETGVRLREILEALVPRGWFLPVTPGTKEVTLGGALAFDIHGKNHHQDGSISHFVKEIELLKANGKTTICGPEQNETLFWATISGAGLTGIITEVELELQPIETAYMKKHTIKASSLSEAFALFEEHGSTYPYSVAWVDCLASGKAFGQSHLMFGCHATTDQVDMQRQQSPLDYKPTYWAHFPFNLPTGMLNTFTVKAFNQLYYARQRAKSTTDIVGIDAFFYPLDAVGNWNRMYGKRGFTQFQCVLPTQESYGGVAEILQQIQEAGFPPFLAVLKRMGKPDGGMLTFPMEGYTLALDIPRLAGITKLMQSLHEVTARRGGRIYLAKDAYLRPETFREMYPAYPKWLEVKRHVDPSGQFASDLARRLDIGK